VTTDSAHHKPIGANVLDRRFDGWRVNQAWVADVTYVATNEGWLYLACVMDLASRRIGGWSMSERIKADLVCQALKSAFWQRKPSAGLIMHSDRGSQYASDTHRRLIKDYRMDPIDEQESQVLGQRADGELLQDAEGRAHPSASLRHPRAGQPRHRRLDRRLLQSLAHAFVDRLQDPS
jgi:transposase InsO family protein